MSDCYIQPGTPGVLLQGGQLSFSVGSHDLHGGLIQRPFFMFLQPADAAAQLLEWRIQLSQTANGGAILTALSLPPIKTLRVPALGSVYRGAGVNVTILSERLGGTGREFLRAQFFEGALEPYWLSGEEQDLALLPSFCTEVLCVNARTFDPETYEFLDAAGVPFFTSAPVSTAQGGARLPVPARAVAVRTTTPGHLASFNFRVLG